MKAFLAVSTVFVALATLPAQATPISPLSYRASLSEIQLAATHPCKPGFRLDRKVSRRGSSWRCLPER